jgi:hypothetical protein
MTDRYRPPLSLIWPALVCLAILGWAMAALGCNWNSEPAIPRLPGLGAMAPIKGQDYSILTYIAGLCSFLAVASMLAGVYLPFLRKLAPVAIACAVGCWALRVLLVKYLWLAILVAVVAGVIFALLYVWGHRKWIERKTGVDIPGV